MCIDDRFWKQVFCLKQAGKGLEDTQVARYARFEKVWAG